MADASKYLKATLEMRRMEKPDVTVLIPTYNRAELLRDCLESLLGQTLSPAQVIVINDGSSEETAKALVPYRNSIEYFETTNLGKPGALNAAMPHVRGDYVWIFDDDDIALPDALERFAKGLERRPDCGFAYSTFYISRTTGDGRLEVEREWQLEEIKENEFLPRLMEANFLCGAGIFVRTSCYKEVGLFREDLIRSQDYEMAVRLSRKYRGTRIDGPTFHYRRHPGMRGSPRDRFLEELRVEKWREYDGKFFRDLRSELRLDDYLPKQSRKNELDPLDARRAYLKRASIMASKALFDEMLEDIGLAMSVSPSGAPLSEAEVAGLWQAIRHTQPGDPIYTQPKLVRALRKVCKGSEGREVRAELGRAIYWHLRGVAGKGKYRQAMRMAFADYLLLGFFVLAKLALGKALPKPARIATT